MSEDTMPVRIHVSMNQQGTRGHAERYAFDGSVEYIRADTVLPQSVLLKQMDELLADINLRDWRIAELTTQLSDAGETDIDWYRQELSQSAVVLRKQNERIAELEAALAELCDLQNGPPLLRDADRWQQVMNTARELLKGQPE